VVHALRVLAAKTDHEALPRVVLPQNVVNLGLGPGDNLRRGDTIESVMMCLEECIEVTAYNQRELDWTRNGGGGKKREEDEGLSGKLEQRGTHELDEMQKGEGVNYLGKVEQPPHSHTRSNCYSPHSRRKQSSTSTLKSGSVAPHIVHHSQRRQETEQFPHLVGCERLPPAREALARLRQVITVHRRNKGGVVGVLEGGPLADPGQAVRRGLDAPIHIGAHVLLRHLLHLLQVLAGRAAVEDLAGEEDLRGGGERGDQERVQGRKGGRYQKAGVTKVPKGAHGI
jgi:hypothetical protein